MGCANSAPVKDLAAAANSNGVTDHLKSAMDDAANLDFDKAQEDLKQVSLLLKTSFLSV